MIMATATDAVPGLSLPLAPRMRGFPAYPLADVPQIKRDLVARGVDVIDLGAGDADLAAPPAAIEALREAALTPAMGRYAFQLGLPAFRESVAAFMERRFGVQLDPFREIAPLLGSKEGIAHIALCYVGAGDVTVMPDPGYQPYLGGTLLAGGEPYAVPLQKEQDYLIDLEALPQDVAAFCWSTTMPTARSRSTAIARRAFWSSTARATSPSSSTRSRRRST
jgi:LL-diaminopimelate aminotransferase